MVLFTKKHLVMEPAKLSVVLKRRKDRVYQTYHVKGLMELSNKQRKWQESLFKLIKSLRVYSPPFEAQIVWGKQKSKHSGLLYGKKMHTVACWNARQSTIFVYEVFFREPKDWQKRMFIHEIGHALFDYTIILKQPYFKRFWSSERFHLATEIFAHLYSIMPKAMFYKIRNHEWLKALFDVADQFYAKKVHAALYAFAMGTTHSFKINMEDAKIIAIALYQMKSEKGFRNWLFNYFSPEEKK